MTAWLLRTMSSLVSLFPSNYFNGILCLATAKVIPLNSAFLCSKPCTGSPFTHSKTQSLSLAWHSLPAFLLVPSSSSLLLLYYSLCYLCSHLSILQLTKHSPCPPPVPGLFLLPDMLFLQLSIGFATSSSWDVCLNVTFSRKSSLTTLFLSCKPTLCFRFSFAILFFLQSTYCHQ